MWRAAHAINVLPHMCFQCACSCYTTRLSSPLPRYTVHGDTSLLTTAALHGAWRHISPHHCRATRCTETRLSSPLPRYTVHGDTSLLTTVALHGARRHVSPHHCRATRCAETRLSSSLPRYTVHGDTALVCEGCYKNMQGVHQGRVCLSSLTWYHTETEAADHACTSASHSMLTPS